MALTKILQAIKNKWRIENLYYKNWLNSPHSYIKCQGRARFGTAREQI